VTKDAEEIPIVAMEIPDGNNRGGQVDKEWLGTEEVFDALSFAKDSQAVCQADAGKSVRRRKEFEFIGRYLVGWNDVRGAF
jgi:hypothetical protein